MRRSPRFKNTCLASLLSLPACTPSVPTPLSTCLESGLSDSSTNAVVPNIITSTPTKHSRKKRNCKSTLNNAIFSPLFRDATPLDAEFTSSSPQIPNSHSAPSPSSPIPSLSSTSKMKERHSYARGLDMRDPIFKEMRQFRTTLPPKPVNLANLLPAKTLDRKFTLVLDLDETLVHCNLEPLTHSAHTFPVSCNGHTYTVYARTRPHLASFLETVSELFEVVLFTASQKVYADNLIDLLDPKGCLFHHRIFREVRCYFTCDFTFSIL